jgi:hypothetical protein
MYHLATSFHHKKAATIGTTKTIIINVTNRSNERRKGCHGKKGRQTRGGKIVSTSKNERIDVRTYESVFPFAQKKN